MGMRAGVEHTTECKNSFRLSMQRGFDESLWILADWHAVEELKIFKMA